MASVLDDLERVLVEIANSPSTMTADEFNEVRKRIEQQGIIFKVRVFGDSVREREYRADDAERRDSRMTIGTRIRPCGEAHRSH